MPDSPPTPKLRVVFFRRKQSASGQCLQLLESYRNAQGQPRHRVVVSLGDTALPAAHWPAIAAAVSHQIYGQPHWCCVTAKAGWTKPMRPTMNHWGFMCCAPTAKT